MFRFLCVLLRDFHLRRRICPPVGNVSEQCAWYRNVHRRSGSLDRHVPHRSADSMASCQCPAFCSSRHLLPLSLMCVPYLLIMWKLVPETTGKTLEKIERYWKER